MVYRGHMALISTLAAPVARRSRQALKDQVGVEVSSVEPFGLAGSGDSSPDAVTAAAESAAIQLRATAMGRAVCSDKAIRSWGSLVSTTGSGQALA